MATINPIAPLSIGRQLNFTAGRMNALCQHLLEPYSVSLPQWAVLSCLWRNGDLTVGTLSELVGTGFPATSRLIERMEDRDLVSRRRDDADGRSTIVSATEKANALSHLANFHETINTALFTDFSKEERELTFALLRRMESNAKKALE